MGADPAHRDLTQLAALRTTVARARSRRGYLVRLNDRAVHRSDVRATTPLRRVRNRTPNAAMQMAIADGTVPSGRGFEPQTSAGDSRIGARERRGKLRSELQAGGATTARWPLHTASIVRRCVRS